VFSQLLLKWRSSCRSSLANLGKEASEKRGRQGGNVTVKGRGAAGLSPNLWLALDIDGRLVWTTVVRRLGLYRTPSRTGKELCKGKPRHEFAASIPSGLINLGFTLSSHNLNVIILSLAAFTSIPRHKKPLTGHIHLDDKD
jgi:hypothetical protein